MEPCSSDLRFSRALSIRQIRGNYRRRNQSANIPPTETVGQYTADGNSRPIYLQTTGGYTRSYVAGAPTSRGSRSAFAT